MAEQWISVMEAAARLRVTHQTIRNWMAVGKLQGKKFPPFGFQAVNAADVERLRRERTDAR
jgi:hypothetical protein